MKKGELFMFFSENAIALMRRQREKRFVRYKNRSGSEDPNRFCIRAASYLMTDSSAALFQDHRN